MSLKLILIVACLAIAAIKNSEAQGNCARAGGFCTSGLALCLDGTIRGGGCGPVSQCCRSSSRRGRQNSRCESSGGFCTSNLFPCQRRLSAKCPGPVSQCCANFN